MMSLIENKCDDIVYMKSPNSKTKHAFTTRFGGVSSVIHQSLNLAHRSNDEYDNVKENYSRLCKILGISTDDIVCSNQVHGTHIRVATKDDRNTLFMSKPDQADGSITQTPGVALMVFTADCVPILLHDPVKKIIGAVHAGWRGTVADIAGVAIRKMESEFNCSPADIRAAIGPCISMCCFETNNDVTDALAGSLPGSAGDCIIKHGDKFKVDLKQANRIFLENAGVTDIIVSDECTSCLSDKYWSHRKTGGQRGSQVAIIVL